MATTRRYTRAEWCNSYFWRMAHAPFTYIPWLRPLCITLLTRGSEIKVWAIQCVGETAKIQRYTLAEWSITHFLQTARMPVK